MTFTAAEQRSLHFYAWEQLGRGYLTRNYPVEIEPPCLPFSHSAAPHLTSKPLDDGYANTWLSSLEAKLFNKSRKSLVPDSDEVAPSDSYEDVTIASFPFGDTYDIVEFSIHWPQVQGVDIGRMEQFLTAIATTACPVTFELVGTGSEIISQIACEPVDADLIAGYVKTFFPEVILRPNTLYLYEQWNQISDRLRVLELGLDEEFMRPLAIPQRLEPDPLTAVISILDQLQEGEMGILQVMFKGSAQPWASNILRAVTDGKGGAFFSDAPEMLPLAKEKISKPLFGCTIRTVGVAASGDVRADTIAVNMAHALFTATQRPGSNALSPVLGGTAEDPNDVVDSIFWRRSYRVGMLVNSRELLNFVHFLSPQVHSEKFASPVKSRSIPKQIDEASYILGTNEHHGQRTEVGLTIPQRLRHIHVIGATGTGKSTLLLTLIKQDILGSNGAAILDPHGDLIDDILKHTPEHLAHRLVILDPSDMEYSVGFNLLSASSEHEKIMLSSDLADIFRRQTTSWGDQMEIVMQNAIAAFLESTRGGTLLDLRKFLVSKDFRHSFLPTVQDDLIRSYWLEEFPGLRSGTVSSLLSRLQFFLRPKPVRHMLMQEKGLDFSSLLNDGKILLVKLSQGLIGEANSHLLGSLILTKIYQAALGRQNLSKEERKPFFLYIDEFQNFITPTLEGVLSGARKYGLGMVLAHQSLDQLFRRDAGVGNSVIANTGTRISFQVGDRDADVLAKSFSYFDSNDLLSLSVGQAIARVGSRQHDFNLKTHLPPEVDSSTARVRLAHFREKNRVRYAVPIETLETFRPTPNPTKKEKPIPLKPEPPLVEEPPIIEEVIKDPPIPQEPEPIDITAAAESFIQAEEERQEITMHRHIQNLIKKMAEERGYLAIIEEETSNPKGRVDVGLTKDQERIACEIASTTTNKHELGNIRKCLTNGYTIVAVISHIAKRLENIQVLAHKQLSSKDLRRVQFFSPDAFITWLDERSIQQVPTEKRIKGYRVKVNYTKREQRSNAKGTIVETLLKSRKGKF